LVHEPRGRSKGGKFQYIRKDYKSKSRDPKAEKKFACFYCGVVGYFKKACRKYKQDLQDGKVEEKEKGTAIVATGDGVVVLCDGEQCLHATDHMIEWVVDTGTSFHVTPRRDLFSNYVAGYHGSVKMGNASSSAIHGIGDVCIKTALGYTLTLKEVRHVHDLRLNLMSCIMLDRQGYTSNFGSGAWRLSKGSLTVARGKVCCTLYKTISEVCRDGVNMAAAELTPELWH
jgi:hypothetical protein